MVSNNYDPLIAYVRDYHLITLPGVIIDSLSPAQQNFSNIILVQVYEKSHSVQTILSETSVMIPLVSQIPVGDRVGYGLGLVSTSSVYCKEAVTNLL